MEKLNKTEKRKNIERIIDNVCGDKKYYSDINLINELSTEFTNKGLPRSIPNKLFMGVDVASELTTVELAYLTKCLMEYKSLGGNLLFSNHFTSLQDYFEDFEIIEMKEYEKEKDYVESIIFENVFMLSPTVYICPFVPATDIALYKKSELFGYDFEAQRECKLRNIGTKGTVAKDISINPESIKNIATLINKNDYIPDLITMNIPKFDGNTPDVVFQNGILKITPHFDSSQSNITMPCITDGWHRINSCFKAVQDKIKDGEDPNGIKNGFIFLVTILNKNKAREHFKRINTFNPVSTNYLETFNTNTETKFVESIVNYSDDKNIFNKDVVMRTFEEVKAFNKLTTYKVLEDAVKYAEIDTVNVLAEIESIPKIVNFITKFIDYVAAKLFPDSNNAIFDLKTNTNYLDINIFIGYMEIASRINSLNEVNKYIIKLFDVMNEANINKEIEDLGLNNKNYSARKISDYFKNIVL